MGRARQWVANSAQSRRFFSKAFLFQKSHMVRSDDALGRRAEVHHEQRVAADRLVVDVLQRCVEHVLAYSCSRDYR